MLGYLGRVTVETIEAFAKPKHNLRIAAIFHQIEETGINALPIVGLLSFLIGVVIAYQGIDPIAPVRRRSFSPSTGWGSSPCARWAC